MIDDYWLLIFVKVTHIQQVFTLRLYYMYTYDLIDISTTFIDFTLVIDEVIQVTVQMYECMETSI